MELVHKTNNNILVNISDI